MTASNVVDVNDPTANMYGCQPCPQCGSKFRYCTTGLITETVIACDDCGKTEIPVEVNS